MGVTKIPTAGMDRQEWLKLRKEGIGGSDAGAICGLNPYASPMSVYQDKTSPEISEQDNEAMRQGGIWRIMWPGDLWRLPDLRYGAPT